ncbi:MAG: type restriction enzyme methyltransferase subunit [Chthonomonadaceae bacterium]|nr:type restriction enzyme methyltransferase subunit [Chthonomonadaceae bacterium]
MPTLNIPRTRKLLEDFDFSTLFIEELNWSRPVTRRPGEWQHEGVAYAYRHIAELAGVVVMEVTGPEEALPPAKVREAVQKGLTGLHRENLLIFVDKQRTQSLWRWVKREDGKTFPREHLYLKGQPGDLFISKISGMVFDISRFDAHGKVSLIAVSDALRNALDVERVTKKFFTEYADQRVKFTELIAGIDDERQRRWYASVLLNRLMFIYFLQRKLLIDGGERDYLQKKLVQTVTQYGKDNYYEAFLQPLFFEGFARPERERSPQAKALLGIIPYLNGGLFLEHKIEEAYRSKIFVPDAAFANLFGLFEHYSWNLDDTPEGQPDEINPDVLGYIFEKYINQKEFGAYYTRPEITEYLCEHTIHQLILDTLNRNQDIPGLAPVRRYHDIGDLLTHLDAPVCRRLLYDVLPHLSLLDPACGSGAFLVAAMKTLVNIYGAITGRIDYLSDASLTHWLNTTRKDHRSLNYHIKRKIVTENLYGVDIMEEGADIARLRLFLALVSSVKTVDELEPLPNIDFNILAGNSLIGLLHVNENDFNGRLQLYGSYSEVVAEKNRLVASYRDLAEQKAFRNDLQTLRDDIQQKIAAAGETLDELLLDEFRALKIPFEQATWDTATGKEGKPTKRPVNLTDIKNLQPFHWGYQFDEILKRGGFDAIITNPPWEIFKPQAKEFLTDYAEGITKNKMTIKEFEEKQAEALSDDKVRIKWEAYLSRFPHVSAYYRSAKQYENQISVVKGKKAGTDINLYKLFTEQCYNLLRPGGQCGIVLPSGLYTDMGTKQLRELLFGCTHITGLFCFENRKEIFEGVHRSFKFIVLTFGKVKHTDTFPAAFMRHDVAELRDFPHRGALEISVEMVHRLSPDSLSVMEFKDETDVHIAEKMLHFPLLGEKIEGTWNLVLTNEFHMTNDSKLFRTVPGLGHLPLYEGKMIHQFTHEWGKPKYWIDEQEGRKSLCGRAGDNGQVLDYQGYRLAHRSIARSTDERTMIATVLPRKTFYAHSLNATRGKMAGAHVLVISALLNSFVFDGFLRQKVSGNLTMFYIYQMPVPRLTSKDAMYLPVVERAARLICTAPEFDDLAREVGLKGHVDGATDLFERAQLRAELDGLVAHLYGLTEAEFVHILSAFPLVAEPVKIAAQNAYRDVARGLIK